jgi:organic hydroperoxide reductase OsmC/OhrA
MSHIRKSRQFIYKNHVKWLKERKGLLSSSGKSTIEVATPPEFKGHPGIWTPEDFFVSSVNICIMNTFLYFAEREKLELVKYESFAEGTLEQIENKFMFYKIKVFPQIFVASSADIEKAKNLLELSEKGCLISNSIKSDVEIKPEIEIVSKE